MIWKSLFWPLKVNAAVGGIGIPPTAFSGRLRTFVQRLGLDAQLSPQETALVLVSLTLGIDAPTDFELIVSTWLQEGRVDLDKPEVIDALYEIGSFPQVETPPWYFDAIDYCNGELDEEFREDVHDYTKTPIAQLFAKSRASKFPESTGEDPETPPPPAPSG